MSTIPEPLPRAVYRTEQVRALDRRAIEQLGIPASELMERAGQAAVRWLRQRWPAAASLLIYCGAGNNAGDGYVVGRLAQAAGLRVRVLAVADPAALSGAAGEAYRAAVAAGVPIARAAGDSAGMAVAAADSDLIVDALLGTGLARDLSGAFAAAVRAINGAGRPVLALDVPSGLDSDSGHPRGVAVQATATISFVGLKTGCYLGQGPDCCGELAFSALGLPPDLDADFAPVLRRLDAADLGQVLERRPRTAHKGLSGNVLLIGGAPGMSGAVRLAAEAALRAGAGLVRVGTHRDSVATIMAGRPEIMCRAIDSAADVMDWLEAADVLVLGPGLGLADWGRQLFAELVAAPLPLVVDADALNLLAEAPLVRERWILTPHPGEAARLLERTTAEVQAARDRAAGDLARRFGAVAVLKGASSLVAQAFENDSLSLAVCGDGNPGMATAGMGDVLSGVTGALLAQIGRPAAAAEAAVLVHALAGDDAARDGGERGLVASDLMAWLRRRVNPPHAGD